MKWKIANTKDTLLSIYEFVYGVPIYSTPILKNCVEHPFTMITYDTNTDNKIWSPIRPDVHVMKITRTLNRLFVIIHLYLKSFICNHHRYDNLRTLSIWSSVQYRYFLQLEFIVDE